MLLLLLRMLQLFSQFSCDDIVWQLGELSLYIFPEVTTLLAGATALGAGFHLLCHKMAHGF